MFSSYNPHKLACVKYYLNTMRGKELSWQIEKMVPPTLEMIQGNPYNYTFDEVAKCMGEERAKSLFKTLYKNGVSPKNQTMTIKDIYVGGDTTKYAFELQDGYCIETVCIKRRTGNTVCVSTMVGCPVGCIFCASGKNGFIRNLSPAEIVQQIVLLKERVNRIVFMGMGEPLSLIHISEPTRPY